MASTEASAPSGMDELNYDLIKREKVQSGAFIKSMLKALFSHVGLVVACVAIAVLGQFFEYQH